MRLLKAPFLVLHFSYYVLMTFLAMFSVLLVSMLMILLSTLIFDQASDLWQQLEVTPELESDLRDIVDWSGNWPVDFNAGKTQLVSFDQSNNTSSIDVKMDGSALVGKLFFSKLEWDF